MIGKNHFQQGWKKVAKIQQIMQFVANLSNEHNKSYINMSRYMFGF